MLQPSTDGRASGRGRTGLFAPVDARGQHDAGAAAFMHAVRTRSANIIGFAELLTDATLRLTPEKRREYELIVRDEGRALDRDVRLFLDAPR